MTKTKTSKRVFASFVAVAMAASLAPMALALDDSAAWNPLDPNNVYQGTTNTVAVDASEVASVGASGDTFVATVNAAAAVIPTKGKDDSGNFPESYAAADPKTAITADDLLKKVLSINLVTEKIEPVEGGFTPTAYSLDAGAKWTVKAFDDKALKKLLDKGGELWLTDSYDKKNKCVTAGVDYAPEVVNAKDEVTKKEVPQVVGGVLVKFKKFDARATITDKPTAVYAKKDMSEGNYYLSDKEGTKDVQSTLIIGYADSTKKAVINDGAEENPKEVWYYGSAFSKGIPVQPLPTTGKAVKSIVLAKIPPANAAKIYAGSKTVKVNVSSEIKPTAIKADYKKGVVKLKKGLSVAGYKANIDADTAKNGLTLTGDSSKADSTKGIFELGDAICYWTAATIKKPGSPDVEYALASPADALQAAQVGTVAKGKLSQAKTVEGLVDKSTNKWGKPKIEGKGAQTFRTKSTAKANKLAFVADEDGKSGGWVIDDSELTAAGVESPMYVDYGTYKEGTKEKTGVLKVYTNAAFTALTEAFKGITFTKPADLTAGADGMGGAADADDAALAALTGLSSYGIAGTLDAGVTWTSAIAVTAATEAAKGAVNVTITATYEALAATSETEAVTETMSKTFTVGIAKIPAAPSGETTTAAAGKTDAQHIDAAQAAFAGKSADGVSGLTAGATNAAAKTAVKNYLEGLYTAKAVTVTVNTLTWASSVNSELSISYDISCGGGSETAQTLTMTSTYDNS